MESVLDFGDAAGDELGDGGADHVREREDAQHEEVHRQQQVDVVLAEHLEQEYQLQQRPVINCRSCLRKIVRIRGLCDYPTIKLYYE